MGLLRDLASSELTALQYDVAAGVLDEDALAERIQDMPIVIWGLEAEKYQHTALKQASANVYEAIEKKDLVTSKWLIARETMSPREAAAVEILKIRAMNERMTLLGRLKEHSQNAYKAALESMGLLDDSILDAPNTIQRLNAELRKTEKNASTD